MSKLEDIKAMAKTRGFFWPSAEIYKSSAGLWSYGPLGVALKQNLISEWRKAITGDMLEIDGSQIMPAAVFNSSGHLSSFQDPITECKKCGSFRADKLIEKVYYLQLISYDHKTFNILMESSMKKSILIIFSVIKFRNSSFNLSTLS